MTFVASKSTQDTARYGPRVGVLRSPPLRSDNSTKAGLEKIILRQKSEQLALRKFRGAELVRECRQCRVGRRIRHLRPFRGDLQIALILDCVLRYGPSPQLRMGGFRVFSTEQVAAHSRLTSMRGMIAG